MKYLPILFLMVLIGSCATILHTDNSIIKVHSYPTSAKIINNYTDTICCTVSHIVVPRSNKNIHLTLIKEVVIKRKLSDEFIYINAFTPYFLGYLLDWRSPKKYDYPSDIYINLKDSSKEYTHKNNIPSEEVIYMKPKVVVPEPLPIFNLTLNIPLFNEYDLRYNGKNYSRQGALGFSCGAEIYLNKKYYLSGKCAYMPQLHYGEPVGGAIDTFSLNNSHSFQYGAISLMRKVGRFDFGVGLAYQKYKWQNTKYETYGYYKTIDSSVTKVLAPRLEMQYNIAPYSNLSISWQPSLDYNRKNSGQYFSYFNLEFIFKMPIITRKK